MRWTFVRLIFACLLTNLPLAHGESTQRGLSLIVVSTEPEANEIRSRVRSGSSFEALATLYSTHPSGPRGGYLGQVDEGRLDPRYRSALQGVNAGAVSSAIQVNESFVLLKWNTPEEDHWRSTQDKAMAVLERGCCDAAALFLDAVQAARNFGEEDIRLAESLRGLAQARLLEGQTASAGDLAHQSLAILEHAFGSSHEGLLPSLTILADVAGSEGRFGDAEDLQRRIFSIRWSAPGNTGVSPDQVLEKFADVLILSHTQNATLKKALGEYWRLISDSHLRKDFYIGMRDALWDAPLVTEAESLMRRAIGLYPTSRQLQHQLGELYAKWGKYEKAIDAFQQAALLIGPQDPEVDRRQRGLIYERIAEMNFSLVRFDDAFAALTTALEVNPSSLSARLLLGALYLRRDRLHEADAEYHRVLSANPSLAAAYEGLAQVQLTQGLYVDAVENADHALMIDPNLQSARYVKATALIRGGRTLEGRLLLTDYQHREAERQSALEQSQQITEVVLAASSLLARGQREDAMSVLREGLRSNPRAPILYLKLGLIQSDLGLHPDAVRTFETMLSLNLEDPLVHRQLSREYDALGETDAGQRERALYLQEFDRALQARVAP